MSNSWQLRESAALMGSLHIKTCDYAASSMKINSFPYDTCCQDSITKLTCHLRSVMQSVLQGGGACSQIPVEPKGSHMLSPWDARMATPPADRARLQWTLMHWRILHVIVPPLRIPHGTLATQPPRHVTRPRTNEVTAPVRVHEQCKGLPHQRKRDTEHKKYKKYKKQHKNCFWAWVGAAFAIPHGKINYRDMYRELGSQKSPLLRWLKGPRWNN